MRSKLSVLLLPGLIIFVCLFSFAAYLLITNQPDITDTKSTSEHTINFQDEQEITSLESSTLHDPSEQTFITENDAAQTESDNQEEPAAASSQETEAETEPPGKDVNFQLDDFTSTDFLVDGTVKSDIGEMAFNSVLLPSNEVKLTLRLNQPEMDDIELVAYFDLAYFRMELDGGNRILNEDHKKLLKLTSLNLQPRFTTQYQEYEIPEHALMMVQMLEYWSVSPEGFVHEKREIVSQ